MQISADSNINVHVDGDVKNKAQEIFSTLGMDMTTAINIFLRQSIRKNGIPFELVVETPISETPQEKSRQFGRMKEKIRMSDDWDAPLEDFKEYM